MSGNHRPKGQLCAALEWKVTSACPFSDGRKEESDDIVRDIETSESVVSHSVALGESPEWGFWVPINPNALSEDKHAKVDMRMCN